MIYAGTGHRPPKLGLGYAAADRKLLGRFVLARLQQLEGVDHIISGMAQGFDRALATSAAILKIPFIAALPFVGMELSWPADDQVLWRKLLARAADVVILSEKRSRESYLERDRWMVDNADALLALYDENERKSGTGATVAYARKLAKPVTNWWDGWVKR